MKIFKIYDWAGNDKTDFYGIFESIDDAWSALYDKFENLEGNEFEEQINEFYVMEVTA